MIDDGVYFVLMRCGGTLNEQSSGTLVKSLHSMCGPGAGPGFIVDQTLSSVPVDESFHEK